jgi:hypothetical protein
MKSEEIMNEEKITSESLDVLYEEATARALHDEAERRKQNLLDYSMYVDDPSI